MKNKVKILGTKEVGNKILTVIEKEDGTKVIYSQIKGCNSMTFIELPLSNQELFELFGLHQD